MPNPYFNEQLAQAHRQVLLQEAQQEQLLAQLPETRHSLAQYITAKLSVFLLAARTRLKRFASHRQPVASE
jgi:cell division protein FtsB